MQIASISVERKNAHAEIANLAEKRDAGGMPILLNPFL
jgi:hypothetical protein